MNSYTQIHVQQLNNCGLIFATCMIRSLILTSPTLLLMTYLLMQRLGLNTYKYMERVQDDEISDEIPTHATQYYNKMTIAQLREVIQRKGLKVKNVTKLKKKILWLLSKIPTYNKYILQALPRLLLYQSVQAAFRSFLQQKKIGQWNIRQIREEPSDEERSKPVDLDVCAKEVNQMHDDCIQRPVVMASCDGDSISEPGISWYFFQANCTLMNMLVRQVTEIREDCLTVAPCFLLLNRGFPFTTMAHLSVNSKQGNALAKKQQIIQFSLLLCLLF